MSFSEIWLTQIKRFLLLKTFKTKLDSLDVECLRSSLVYHSFLPLNELNQQANDVYTCIHFLTKLTQKQQKIRTFEQRSFEEWRAVCRRAAYLEKRDEVGLWGGLELSLQPVGELLGLDLGVLYRHKAIRASLNKKRRLLSRLRRSPAGPAPAPSHSSMFRAKASCGTPAWSAWRGSSCISLRFLAFPVGGETVMRRHRELQTGTVVWKQEVEPNLGHHGDPASRRGGRRAGQRGGRNAGRLGRGRPTRRYHRLGLLRRRHLHRNGCSARGDRDGLLGDNT